MRVGRCMIPFWNSQSDRNVVVSVSLTRFVPRYGKNRVLYPKNALKMAKIDIFCLKCQKIVFLSQKQRFYLKSLRGARRGDFLRICWIFFMNSSKFFWKKCHFWLSLSRDIRLPKGWNCTFWVGNQLLYTIFSFHFCPENIKNRSKSIFSTQLASP